MLQCVAPRLRAASASRLICLRKSEISLFLRVSIVSKSRCASSRSSVCMLQCVAVYCSVLQCVAVCCSVLQCVAECCSVLPCVAVCYRVLQCVSVCCSVLQCVAV